MAGSLNFGPPKGGWPQFSKTDEQKRRKRSKVYICGPMRGYPQFNFPAFFEAEEFLTVLGYTCFNPARHDVESGIDLDPSYSFRDAFKWDFVKVTESDWVCVLDGSLKSRGATAEIEVARLCGIPTHEYCRVRMWAKWEEDLEKGEESYLP